ncbi:MAG: DNA repair exonuclease [Clostridia bacterium]|nr:DNA repair exonuclease [Clostridia bacterium]
MNNVKILHTADIHIGARDAFLGTTAESRRFETLLTFERIVDLAKEKGIQLIAIAGDLFDSNNIEPAFIDGVFNKIKTVPEIKVVFAAGNHDPLTADSPFLTRTLPQNLYVLPTKESVITFEDIKVKVYGKSFESVYLKGEEEFTLPTDNDYINIMVQHGELRADLGSDYNSITPKFVKKSGMDYIALGHVHARTPIGRIENTHFAYCGCPEGQGFDELDQKGVYLGTISKSGSDLEFIPVSKRQHIVRKIDITGAEDICKTILDDLKANIDNYADNLYKIELVGNIPPEAELNLAEITARLSAVLYFVKLRDKTEFLVDLELLATEPTLKGVFVKNILEKLKTADDKEAVTRALNIGLRAFNSEVKYNED